MNDTTAIDTVLFDSIDRLFSDHCDKRALDRAEGGEFPSELWRAIVANGYHHMALPDSGVDLRDVFILLKLAGKHALPLPLAETLLATRWLTDSGDELLGIGKLGANDTLEIPWGRRAKRYLAVNSANELYEVTVQPFSEGCNLAGEALDVTEILSRHSIDTTDNPYELLALSRAAYAAGALEAVLALSIDYAKQRQQFGRALSAFQVIQHNLAVMAAEVAAAGQSVSGAIAMLGEPRFVAELAAARARTAEASTLVAESAHQIHGAIGFTYEYRLHHLTRRLWAWREEYGNEVYWQTILGRHLSRLGADNVWDFIATPQ